MTNDYSPQPQSYPFRLHFNAMVITTTPEPTEPYIFVTVPNVKVNVPLHLFVSRIFNVESAEERKSAVNELYV